MELSTLSIWLVLSSQVGVFVLGYVLGFVGGKRQQYKEMRAQNNFSDLK